LCELGVPGFVPVGDSDALAAAIDEIVELTAAERARRGAFGNDVLTQSWDIRATMPRWYAIYATLRA
jgi:hypothetical protein